MSFTIHTPDALRTIVESTTGGRQTVLYTNTGAPSIMNIIPRFNIEDIDTSIGSGLHPAFIVNDKEVSEIFIGTYQGYENEYGELCSLPGMTPTTSKSFIEFNEMIKNNGSGWHIMTNAERSALALWSWRNKTQPHGNTNYGRDGFDKFESALRSDGKVPGVADTGGISLTGSGGYPSWRHDGTVFGISDLCGNVDEFVTGVRLVDGEIQVLVNNNAADVLNLTGNADWKSIISDGSYSHQGTVNSFKYDSNVSGVTADCADPILSNTIVNFNGIQGDSSDNTQGYISVPFQELLISQSISGITIPHILEVLCLYPFTKVGLNGNSINIKNYGTRYATFGGNYLDGYPNAGIFKLSLLDSENKASITTGARPAFIKL